MPPSEIRTHLLTLTWLPFLVAIIIFITSFLAQTTYTDIAQTISERSITTVAFYASYNFIAQFVYFERLLQGDARIFNESTISGQSNDLEVSFERAAKEESIIRKEVQIFECLKEEILEIGYVRRGCVNHCFTSSKDVSTFLKNVSDSIKLFVIVTFPTGVIINFMRQPLPRTCAIWMECLAVLYSLYMILQLIDCVSRGVLRDYNLKRNSQ